MWQQTTSVYIQTRQLKYLYEQLLPYFHFITTFRLCQQLVFYFKIQNIQCGLVIKLNHIISSLLIIKKVNRAVVQL